MGKQMRLNLILILSVLVVGPGCNVIWSGETGLDTLQVIARGEILPLTNYIHRIRNANCNYQGQLLADYGESLDMAADYGFYYAGGCDTQATPVDMTKIELSKLNTGFLVYNATIFEVTTYRYSYPFDDIPITEALCRDLNVYEIVVQDFNGQRVAKIFRPATDPIKELVTLTTNNPQMVVYESPALKITIDRTKGAGGSRYVATVQGLVNVSTSCIVQNL
jgi:hypothetical protein